jgi:hypothetical protein
MREWKPKKGARVFWMWLGRPVQGRVLEVFPERVERVIKGKRIVRNGSEERPAALVLSDAGNEALKLASELRPEAELLRGTPLPWMKGRARK